MKRTIALRPFTVASDGNSLDPNIIAFGRPYRRANAPKKCLGVNCATPCWVRDGIAAYALMRSGTGVCISCRASPGWR